MEEANGESMSRGWEAGGEIASAWVSVGVSSASVFQFDRFFGLFPVLRFSCFSA